MRQKIIRINKPSIYNFDLILRYIKNSPSFVIEKIIENTYCRAFVIGGRMYLVLVRDEGIDSKYLEVKVIGEEVKNNHVQLVKEKIITMFCLEQDIDKSQKFIANESKIGKLIKMYEGFRPVLLGSVYESIIWAIIGQQISAKVAQGIKKSLLEKTGAKITINNCEYYTDLCPHKVLELSIKQLCDLKLSQRKAEYIHEITKAIINGELDLSNLYLLNREEGCSYLMKHRGIGKWTAESILMRGIGRQDILPAGDLIIRKVVGEMYEYSELLTESQVRKISTQWKTAETWITHLCWFYMQEKIL
ncbi:hypothetical protein ABEX78_30165 [Priestia megaterium]